MKREKRIDSYRCSLEGAERERAGRARLAEQRARDARAKLCDLDHYRAEYLLGLGKRVADGMSGPALRDYHVFLGRLDEAIIQQRQAILCCDTERDDDQRRWREVAVQLKAVSAVIERWRVDERVIEGRTEQREIDERALRQHHALPMEG